jgi:cytochrome c oxidase subunit 3|tara:strand:- start:39349 stop:40014 length:666 start_codon:yes stop_codon:yes gene_type:complete
MTITLIFLAVIMATVITWLLRQTINTQPWVSNSEADAASGVSLNTNPQAIGLTTFLAVATSMFALFASAYTIRMTMPDWSPLNEPLVLWVNTGFLILASIAYQWTTSVALKSSIKKIKIGLIASGVFSLLFLVGQFSAWQDLIAQGMYVSTNPAIAFFYVLTAMHGLHLIGGLYVWARSMIKVTKGIENNEVIRVSVELCTVYWHFLLLVWALLFSLLIST